MILQMTQLFWKMLLEEISQHQLVHQMQGQVLLSMFPLPKTIQIFRQSSAAGEKGQKLKNCTNSIAEACADITLDANVTGDCNTKMEAFQTKVTECKTADACTCWKEAFVMK